MTCEIKYFADLEIELNLKSSTEKSHSKIWLGGSDDCWARFEESEARRAAGFAEP